MILLQYVSDKFRRLNNSDTYSIVSSVACLCSVVSSDVT